MVYEYLLDLKLSKNVFFTLILLVILVNSVIFSNSVFSQDISSNIDSEGSYSKWTVMYYLCYDSGSMYEYAESMLENLSKIGSNDEVNIVVCYDGSLHEDSKIMYINKNGERINLNSAFNWPAEIDTSDPNTLETFCTQTIEKYPADYYALIPHIPGGRGWQEICFHDSSNGVSGISFPVLSNTIRKINNYTNSKLDVLYVGCANGMVEVSYELRNEVEYIVGTQDCFPRKDVITRFTDAVYDLHDNYNMTPYEFSCRTPENLNPKPFYYYEILENKPLPFLNRFLNKKSFKAFHTVKHYPSASVINNSNADLLIKSIDNLSEYLILHLHTNKTKQTIKTARENTQEYGKCYSKFKKLSIFYKRYSFEILAYDCFIDLYDFSENLKGETNDLHLKLLCRNIMDNMNSTVPIIKKPVNDSSHGLSIYFPETKRLYNWYVGFNGELPEPYENLKFSIDTKWDEFLKTYYKV